MNHRVPFVTSLFIHVMVHVHPSRNLEVIKFKEKEATICTYRFLTDMFTGDKAVIVPDQTVWTAISQVHTVVEVAAHGITIRPSEKKNERILEFITPYALFSRHQKCALEGVVPVTVLQSVSPAY